MRRLEQAIGLSRGAIFHHFGDKETLFLALAEQDARRMADVVAEQGLVQVMRDLLRATPTATRSWLGTRLEVSRRLRTDPAFRERLRAHSRGADAARRASGWSASARRGAARRRAGRRAGPLPRARASRAWSPTWRWGCPPTTWARCSTSWRSASAADRRCRRPGASSRPAADAHRRRGRARQAATALVVGELGAVELGVAAAGGEQVVVRAALDDRAVLDDGDLVGRPDRREPVGDDDRRAPVQRLGQRLLHRGLGLGVQVRGGLVEDHHPRRASSSRAIVSRWRSPPESR